MSPLRILHVWSDPTGPAKTAADIQVNALKLALGAYRDELEYHDLPACAPRDLLQQVQALEPDVLHVSGHGRSNGGVILMHQSTGRPVTLSKGELRDLLSVHSGLRLLVLDCCYGKVDIEELKPIAPAFIAAEGRTVEPYPIEYSIALYRSIATGCSLGAAVRASRIAAATSELGGGEASSSLDLWPDVPETQRIQLVSTSAPRASAAANFPSKGSGSSVSGSSDPETEDSSAPANTFRTISDAYHGAALLVSHEPQWASIRAASEAAGPSILVLRAARMSDIDLLLMRMDRFLSEATSVPQHRIVHLASRGGTRGPAGISNNPTGVQGWEAVLTSALRDALPSPAGNRSIAARQVHDPNDSGDTVCTLGEASREASVFLTIKLRGSDFASDEAVGDLCAFLEGRLVERFQSAELSHPLRILVALECVTSESTFEARVCRALETAAHTLRAKHTVLAPMRTVEWENLEAYLASRPIPEPLLPQVRANLRATFLRLQRDPALGFRDLVACLDERLPHGSSEADALALSPVRSEGVTEQTSSRTGQIDTDSNQGSTAAHRNPQESASSRRAPGRRLAAPGRSARVIAGGSVLVALVLWLGIATRASAPTPELEAAPTARPLGPEETEHYAVLSRISERRPPIVPPASNGFLFALVAFSAIGTFLGARWLLLPDQLADERSAHLRELARVRRLELAGLEGSSVSRAKEGHPLFGVEPRAALEPASIEATAVWLRRACDAATLESGSDPTQAADGNLADADVATSTAASTPLDTAAASAAQTLFVWIDVERGDHPWLGPFERLLDAWEAAGVQMRRLHFRFSPHVLIDPATGVPKSVAEIARQSAGAPLIVFSRNLSLASAPGAGLGAIPEWCAFETAWPKRAWIDPDPVELSARTPAHQDEIVTLAAHGWARFPLDESGIEALARRLSGEAGVALPPDKQVLPSLPPRDGDASVGDDTADTVREALRCWALAASIVDGPSWAQLEALRRYLPEVRGALDDARAVRRLIEWVERETGEPAESTDGRALWIPLAFRRRWLETQRMRATEPGTDPTLESLEDRVRSLLLEQLSPRPAEGTLAHLNWTSERAFQELMLGQAERLPELAALLDSPIGDRVRREVSWELAREGTRAHLQPGLHERLRSALTPTQRVPLDALVHGSLRSFAVPSLLAGAMVLASAIPLGGGYGIERISHSMGMMFPPGELQENIVPATYEVRMLPKQPATAGRPAMIELPAGTFWMSDPEAERKRANDDPPTSTRPVSVASFLVSETEISRSQFAAVMGSAPLPDQDNPSFCGGPAAAPADPRPATCISWRKLFEYCNKLSEAEGLSPAYVALDEQAYTYEWNRRADGYRLLTDIEWEYAARGPHEEPETQTRWYGTSVPERVCAYGNVYDRQPEQRRSSTFPCSDGAPGLAPVLRDDMRRPVGFGLAGFGGNASERVWRFISSDDPESARIGPSDSTSRLEGRGASHQDGYDRRVYGRSAGRNAFLADPGSSLLQLGEIRPNLGFRIARSRSSGTDPAPAVDAR